MWDSGFTQTMVSVSSIAEQLCRQKLEDDWSNSESEKKSLLSLPDCLVSTSDTFEEKTKASKNSKISKDSKFNNNVWSSGKLENETGVSKDTEWYSSQMEQMPPKKKHRRSFSIPGETKYDGGSGHHKVHLSRSSLNAAILRPVAVRPCVVFLSHSESKDNNVAAGYSVCEDVPELNLDSDNSFPISGPCSGYYDHSAADFAAADLFQSEHCRSRVAFNKEDEVQSRSASRFTMSRASDLWCSLDGTTTTSNELLSSPNVSSVRSRLSSSALSNSDTGKPCWGSVVANPHQHQTPERKTGLKRRRDEDRPKLDFFKMIETAYENELFSCSISRPKSSSKLCLKEDIGLTSVDPTQNVDSSSPCLQLDSSDPCRTSPASPFISLHHHFLAEKREAGAADDDVIKCFNNRIAVVNFSDQSKKNWMNRTRETLSPKGNHGVKEDRIVGSEFDLELIENN